MNNTYKLTLSKNSVLEFHADDLFSCIDIKVKHEDFNDGVFANYVVNMQFELLSNLIAHLTYYSDETFDSKEAWPARDSGRWNDVNGSAMAFAILQFIAMNARRFTKCDNINPLFEACLVALAGNNFTHQTSKWFNLFNWSIDQYTMMGEYKDEKGVERVYGSISMHAMSIGIDDVQIVTSNNNHHAMMVNGKILAITPHQFFLYPHDNNPRIIHHTDFISYITLQEYDDINTFFMYAYCTQLKKKVKEIIKKDGKSYLSIEIEDVDANVKFAVPVEVPVTMNKADVLPFAIGPRLIATEGMGTPLNDAASYLWAAFDPDVRLSTNDLKKNVDKLAYYNVTYLNELATDMYDVVMRVSDVIKTLNDKDAEPLDMEAMKHLFELPLSHHQTIDIVQHVLEEFTTIDGVHLQKSFEFNEENFRLALDCLRVSAKNLYARRDNADQIYTMGMIVCVADMIVDNDTNINKNGNEYHGLHDIYTHALSTHAHAYQRDYGMSPFLIPLLK